LSACYWLTLGTLESNNSLMSKELLRYDLMVERALRNVVREALSQTAKFGLPGAHHLFITFQTDHAGVELPDHLHEKFPEEMTIVLQHQFWDLQVEDDRFLVSLSFNDNREQLIIPFPAITTFADPSVNFVLQLKFEGGGEVELNGEGAESEESLAPPPAAEAPAEGEDGNVVTLDAFRKK